MKTFIKLALTGVFVLSLAACASEETSYKAPAAPMAKVQSHGKTCAKLRSQMRAAVNAGNQKRIRQLNNQLDANQCGVK